MLLLLVRRLLVYTTRQIYTRIHREGERESEREHHVHGHTYTRETGYACAQCEKRRSFARRSLFLSLSLLFLLSSSHSFPVLPLLIFLSPLPASPVGLPHGQRIRKRGYTRWINFIVARYLSLFLSLHISIYLSLTHSLTHWLSALPADYIGIVLRFASVLFCTAPFRSVLYPDGCPCILYHCGKGEGGVYMSDKCDRKILPLPLGGIGEEGSLDSVDTT